MVMATEEGVRRRKHAGKLEVLSAVGFSVVDAAELLFFPLFVGAMFFYPAKEASFLNRWNLVFLFHRLLEGPLGFGFDNGIIIFITFISFLIFDHNYKHQHY